jgi:ribosomal protein L20
MPRSVNKVAAHQRKKKYFKLAKGYWGARSKVWTVAKHHVEKGLQYAVTRSVHSVRFGSFVLTQRPV